MKRNEPSMQFWTVLGTVNLLTLIYPSSFCIVR